MSKSLICGIILGLLIISLTGIEGYSLDPPKKQGIVLYDDSTQDYGIALINLLGHFYEEYEFKLSHVSKVTPGDVENSDALFILSAYFSPTPPTFILDLIEKRGTDPGKTTCLIGTPSWIKRKPTLRNFTYVEYMGQSYREGSYDIFPLDIEFDSIISTLQDNKETGNTPMIAKKGNIWIVQGFPFFSIHSWIFGDVLHDILGVEHVRKKEVFLRLEDVNPSYNEQYLRNLEDCIEYLQDQGIPFLITVYPVFIDRGRNKFITLNENPKLVEILKKAERLGGKIIMHGVTHQHLEMEISGEGSEFWNVIEDRPFPNEIETFHEKMRYGIGIFKEIGLIPQFFEAPHYNLSLNLQFELKQYFDTIVGAIMLNNRTYKISQSPPYFIHRTYSGLKLLPEQLGYISINDIPGSIYSIKKNALRIKNIVRDPMASFFYHPYVNGAEPLKELIPFFINEGFKFVDISKHSSSPKLVTKEIKSVEREEGKETLYMGNILLLLSGGSVVLLLLTYLGVSRKRKRRLFEG